MAHRIISYVKYTDASKKTFEKPYSNKQIIFLNYKKRKQGKSQSEFVIFFHISTDTVTVKFTTINWNFAKQTVLLNANSSQRHVSVYCDV